MALRILLLTIAAALAGVRHTGAQDPSSAAPPARLLQIDAVVLDRDGTPVTDLKREELEVWIGGYRVPIETVVAVTPETESTGRLIVLLIDDITVGQEVVPRVREIARRFINRMAPQDRMAVVLLNGGSVELTSDASRLLSRIDGLRQSLGGVPVDRIGAHLLTTVATVARQVVEAPERRKTIVAIGSAWLLDTPVPPARVGADVRREWFDALRALALSESTYYVIDPGGVGVTRPSASTGFAREAGGHAFTNSNDLKGTADRILRETGHYLLITVGDPPVGRKAPLRELDVKVLRRGLTVRARRSIPGTH